MPPRLSLRSLTGGRTQYHSLQRAVGVSPAPEPSSVCLFCSHAPSTARDTRRTRRRLLETTRRNNSTATATASAPLSSSSSSSSPESSATRSSADARKDLQEALQNLQRHATNYVNLSRVQLALNALREDSGSETIRIAIVSQVSSSNDSSSAQNTAKEVLRMLLADPLSPEQGWERHLLQHDMSTPLVVRIGAAQPREEGSISRDESLAYYAKGGLLKELKVSAPGLNGHGLEVLLMETNPLADASDGSFQGFEETALVPIVDVPTSNTGRYSPITTPVHKALLVTDGLAGATSIASLPLLVHRDTIAAAVHLPGYQAQDDAPLPFQTIDVETASQGVAAIRASLDRAFEYERLWFKSNMPAIMTWLKAGTLTTDTGTTKEAVRALIASVLRNTLVSIQEEESRRLSLALSAHSTPATIASLNKALADWSEKAHAELQAELDRAFDSRRWSKLNWWKLFWRVDDVGVLSSEMLSQRFLPRAERNVIYLAGQIQGSGLLGPEGGHNVYVLPALISSASTTTNAPSQTPPTTTTTTAISSPPRTKWPTNITFTRNYLQSETVPALQALAQRLVLESTSFSALTSALGGLMYLSSFGLYESGAVAAFGIVWSLRRLQKKWETAREYWQSEIREEGRKAVRAVTISVGQTLDDAASQGAARKDEGPAGELRRTRELVQKAEEALQRLK